jgi:DNA-binding transcriptional regulator YhcF (GntR family)
MMDPREYILQRSVELSAEEEEKQRDEARKNRGFAQIYDRVPNATLQAVAMKSGQAMAMFLWMIENMDTKGGILVSNTTLASVFRIAPQNVSRALKVLRDAGVIMSMKTGGSCLHAINPDVAWRSTNDGKRYALFNASVIVSEKEMRDGREEANRKAKATADALNLKRARAVVLGNTTIELPPPVGRETKKADLEIVTGHPPSPPIEKM